MPVGHDRQIPAASSCRLHLAASTGEATVAQALEALLAAGTPFDYAAVRARAVPSVPPVPPIAIGVPDLTIYDALLAGGTP